MLIEQGVAYKRIVEGEDIKGLTQDELEIIMGVVDFANLKDTLLGAMTAGMEREVEEGGKNGKNHAGTRK